MPSRRAVSVSSCEPCASATSKSPPARPAPQRGQARRASPRALPSARAPAVAADQLGLDPVQLEQLQRLRVVARGDLDLVAALAQERDQRPEDEHVRRRGHVDPDLHAATPRARRGSATAGGRSTWRSCQSVNASRPQSWRREILAPGDVVVEQRAHGLGPEEALAAERLRRERLARERLELAAQPGRGRDREAALPAARRSRRAASGATALRSSRFLREAAHLVPRRQREREGRRRPGRGTGRAPRASAPSTPGRSSRAGRRRGRCRGRRPAGARAARRPRSPRSARGRGRPGRSSWRRPVSSAARVGREDLLPAVVALERRQVRARGRSASPCSRSSPWRVELGRRSTSGRARRGERARRARRAGRRRRCSSRRRARRRPRRRARP